MSIIFDQSFQSLRWWQERYLALVIFLWPWQARWIFWSELLGQGTSEYVTLSVYAVDVLMIVAVLWMYPQVSWRVHRWRSLLVVGSYLWLVSLITGNPLVAGWKLLTVVLVVAFTLVVVQVGDRELALKSFVVAAVGQSLLAIWQFGAQTVAGGTLLGMSSQTLLTPGVSLIATSTGRWLRAYGSLPHPNILGGFLALALLLTIDQYFSIYENFQQWWSSRGVATKRLWREPIVRRTGLALSLTLAVFVIMLAGLLVSLSRSAALAMLLAGVVYLAQKYYQNRIRATVLTAKLLIFTLAVLVVWQTLLPDLWTTRLQLAGRIEAQSRAERIVGYEDALQIAARHAFLGTGLQNYAVALAELHPHEPSYLYQPIHNIWLLLAIELGFVGLVVVGMVFWPFIKKFGTHLLDEAAPVGVAAIVLVSTLGVFDHYLASLHPGLLLWVIVTLAAVGRSSNQHVAMRS